MATMLLLLKSNGLSDVNFVIINGRESAASRAILSDLTNGSGIEVFQETDAAPIWDTVYNGGKDDIFILDRCGRLNYYIPYPLSILHPTRPIVHASLLSTYFDMPCGRGCGDQRKTTPLMSSTTVEPNQNSSDYFTETTLETVIGLKNETLSNGTNLDATNASESSTVRLEFIELATEGLIILEEELSNDNESSIDQGSGDGGSVGNFTGIQFETSSQNLTNSVSIRNPQSEPVNLENGFSLSAPWSIFEFFLKNKEPDPLEVTVTPPPVEANLEAPVTEPAALLATTSLSSEQWQSENNSTMPSSTTERPSVGSSVGATVAPAALPLVVVCEVNQCLEFSTDRLLRARLCCLREEVGSDGEATVGCRSFTSDRCSRMLPLVKCCLKNFSRLLSNFFGSQRNKKRKPGYAA